MYSAFSRLVVLLIILVSMGCEDEKVKEYFDKNGKATPSEVWIYLTGHGVQCPITSVRRSITN